MLCYFLCTMLVQILCYRVDTARTLKIFKTENVYGVFKHFKDLATNLRTKKGLSFSNDRLEKTARNASEIFSTSFVRVIVTMVSQDGTTELDNSTIIPTVIVNMLQ